MAKGANNLLFSAAYVATEKVRYNRIIIFSVTKRLRAINPNAWMNIVFLNISKAISYIYMLLKTIDTGRDSNNPEISLF
eukprot:snap_masked-scaffold_38-processed-gene-2.72-mRNA-1 protein AED:1.00 eAED:1.00 QI:0/0/0/0/1/1/2/0/78